ncbi:MAG: SDR family oxidoreductase [Alphaproteobacteria bacterium]
MGTVLITGANRGIGLEFAKQYAADGWQVIATCRSPDQSRELAALKVEVEPLDVADDSSMRALAGRLAGRPIDLLVNNAGVYGRGDQTLGRLDVDEWLTVLRVDAIAPIRLAELLMENLAATPRPVIANITSKMGSIADNASGGTYLYRSAKAALNAASVSLALDLKGRRIIVVVLHPGWVKTDMGGPHALISPTRSVNGMRSVIAGLSSADSGRFLAYDGASVPW